MPPNPVWYVVPRLGPYVTVQLVPFQTSTRPTITPVEVSRDVPKPTQLVESVQETLARESAPFSLGVVSIDQLVPSQDSTSICWYEQADAPHSVSAPTAMQLVALVHETLPSASLLEGGEGVDITDQVVPSQDSIRGLSVGEVPLTLAKPTATQSVVLTHDTLPRSLPSPGLGLGTTDQTDPFQDSASVVAALLSFPTAMQKVVLVHDTLLRLF